jgi:hypothetical protein
MEGMLETNGIRAGSLIHEIAATLQPSPPIVLPDPHPFRVYLDQWFQTVATSSAVSTYCTFQQYMECPYKQQAYKPLPYSAVLLFLFFSFVTCPAGILTAAEMDLEISVVSGARMRTLIGFAFGPSTCQSRPLQTLAHQLSTVYEGNTVLLILKSRIIVYILSARKLSNTLLYLPTN